MTETRLNRWFNFLEDGDSNPVYTRDSWLIPEEGTEIWCTDWERGQTIKPYGDGCHVYVGTSVFHCLQLMEILEQREREGHKWGIEGVQPTREQHINGWWKPVEIKEGVIVK